MWLGPMHQSLLPYTPERDAYRLLGVRASASTDEITAACRRLARTFHPDRNPSARATAEMQVVNTVRQVLSDPETRAVYDRERVRFHTYRVHAAQRPASAVPPAFPTAALPPPPSPFERYLRAALVGMRAAVAGLLPARCRTCRIVIDGEDAYCAACGTPRLTGG
jgi:curved DNA-binding protein CbpA